VRIRMPCASLISLVLLIPPVLLVPLVSPEPASHPICAASGPCWPTRLVSASGATAVTTPSSRISAPLIGGADIRNLGLPPREAPQPSRQPRRNEPRRPDRTLCQNSPTRGVVTPNHER